MESKAEWLERLPATVLELTERWSPEIGAPYKQTTCAWVAPVKLENGTTAILKIAMRHMEAFHELQFWNGDPAIHVLAVDETHSAILLERCEPGTPLKEMSKQDLAVARLLRRLWRTPTQPHPFRPLSVMTDYWQAETLASQSQTREPWLVIDPKPFIGDPAYDATQHLFNCPERLRVDPLETIHRLASLLEVDAERIRLWMFARAAAEPRDNWTAPNKLATALAP